MKIKKNIIKQKRKLLKIKLIRTKIYKQNNKNNLNIIHIEDVEHRLKKALKIIYKYHIKNKKILFIGNIFDTNKKIKYILNNTNHSIISESLWKNKIKTNKQLLSKNKNILLKLKKKSDLIVLMSKELNEEILKDSYNYKIPLIYFNNNSTYKSLYRIPGNFVFSNKIVRNNLLCSLLITIIKKSNKYKT